MKTLKILLVIMCIFCFGVAAQAQSSKVNTLSQSEWNAIKINGVKWKKIEDTQANETKIKNLFFANSDMKKDVSNEDGDYFSFESKKKGLYLGFNVYNTYDFGMIIDLEYLSITNRNSNITIKGVTLTIGGSIDKLKNVKIDYKNNEIYFTPADSDCCIYLRIKFDPKTKKITEINYYSGTD